MSWLYLFLAIVFEIAGTTLMKLSDGFSVLAPTLGTIVSYVICFTFLSYALKTIEMGTAYAIWCALGIAFVAAIGIIFFHEQVSLIKIVCLFLIILGVVGLKLA